MYVIPIWIVTWRPQEDRAWEYEVRVSQNDLEALLRTLIFNGVRRFSASLAGEDA